LVPYEPKPPKPIAEKRTERDKEKIISEKKTDVPYTLTKVSEPSIEKPYLILKCKAERQIGAEIQKKRKIPILIPLLTSASGITASYLLYKTGRTALAYNIGILSIGSSAGMVTYNLLQKPKRILKEKEKIEPFVVRLKGTEYSSQVLPDEKGNLKISILDFAPFYEKGKIWTISLYSKGIRLDEFTIDPEPIASILLKPKYPPVLSFSVAFDDSTGDRDFFLDAEESGRIVLLVKNSGNSIARNLEVKLTPLTSVPYLNIPRSTKVEMVGSMEARRVVIPISATREVPTTTVELKIEVLEPYFQADAEPRILRFETRKFEPPDLIVYDKGVEEGEITTGKSANVSLVIQNKGTGRAEQVQCEIKIPSGITFLGERKIYNFGTMEPGAWQRIDFPIFVGARFPEESLKISLRLNERRDEFSKNIDVAFPLNRPIQRPKEIVVKGEEKLPTGVTMPPLLTVDVDINIPETKMKNPDAIAVVIGNKTYEDPKVPNVEYADNDARIIREYLIRALGYKEENILFIENARKSDFERVFGSEKEYKGRLYNYVKPEKSDVFIYYTGHGAPDIETKSGYFVPVDCQPDYVRIDGYALETFFRNIAQVRAKSMTVVIDACFSGASEKGMLIAQASPLSGVVIEKGVGSNLNLFTACGPEEIASWYPENRHSLFTYYFLKGLQGNADKNKDNEITLGELKEYLNENVTYGARRQYGRRQNPTFKGDESKVILKLK